MCAHVILVIILDDHFVHASTPIFGRETSLEQGTGELQIELEAYQMSARHPSCKPPAAKQSGNSSDLMEPGLF
jgi:hypothetical protein